MKRSAAGPADLCRRWTLRCELLCAGGPSIKWPAANSTQPQSFSLRVSNDARGINNTFQLSQLCQQGVQVVGANTNQALYTEPQDSCM